VFIVHAAFVRIKSMMMMIGQYLHSVGRPLKSQTPLHNQSPTCSPYRSRIWYGGALLTLLTVHADRQTFEILKIHDGSGRHSDKTMKKSPV